MPSGTGGYEDLSRRASSVSIKEFAVAVASLEDVIRSKESANRPKDQMALPARKLLLRKLRESEGPK